MSALLNKRLARSLWRTKLRLLAVVLMVFVGVFAGITFGGYAHNLGGMYDTMQADDENGANLADLWVDNRSALWTPEEVNSFCAALDTAWESSSVSPSLDSCEGRTVTQGAMFHTNDTGQHIINSLWHGIPDGANADRVWMPEGHSEGRTAVAADEIVIDAHVTEALELSLGDTVSIGAGNATADFTIVGMGYHPLHVLFAPEGELFPSEPGQYVVGYLSDAGMARLTGEVLGTSNMILLDVEGTPAFDLPDTSEEEGDEIDGVKELVNTALGEAALDARIRDRGTKRTRRSHATRFGRNQANDRPVYRHDRFNCSHHDCLESSTPGSKSSQGNRSAANTRGQTLIAHDWLPHCSIGDWWARVCTWGISRAKRHEWNVGLLPRISWCSNCGTLDSNFSCCICHRLDYARRVPLGCFPCVEGKPSGSSSRIKRSKRDASGVKPAAKTHLLDANNAWTFYSLKRA